MRGRRARGRCSESLRLGIGVAVEQRIRCHGAARPKSRAAHLVRIRVARDVIGKIRDAARMRRGSAPGKPRDREIEAAPEKMDGTYFAVEARAKAVEDLGR